MGMKYRPDSEVEEWRARDAIDAMEARLIEAGVATAEELAEMRATVQTDVDAAITFGKESPMPDVSALLENVYTEAGEPAR